MPGGGQGHSRRLVPCRVEDRTVNLNNFGVSPKQPKKANPSSKNSVKRTDRSSSKKTKVAKPSPKIDIQKEKVGSDQTSSLQDSKINMNQSDDRLTSERISKMKQDLYAPKIEFRELKDDEEPEQIAESRVIDGTDKSTVSRGNQFDKKSQAQEGPADIADFEYSRDSGILAPGDDSRVSLSYHEDRGDNSAYLLDLINGKDDDLDKIEDTRKREEIREYRKKKRLAAEEELKIDGKLQ